MTQFVTAMSSLLGKAAAFAAGAYAVVLYHSANIRATDVAEKIASFATEINMSPFALAEKLALTEKSLTRMKLMCVGVACACLFVSKKLLDYSRQSEHYRVQLEHWRAESLRRPEAAGPVPSNKCIVCWDNPRTVINLPCRHMCLCKNCSDTLMANNNERNRKCPACATLINQRMEVFLP